MSPLKRETCDEDLFPVKCGIKIYKMVKKISAEVKGTVNVKQEQIKRIQLTKSAKHGKSYLLMVPKIYAL